MKLFETLTKNELRELIVKNWMSHDGMWFFHTCQEFGIEKANMMNQAAIKSLAALEVARIKKASGKYPEKILSFTQLSDFVDDAFSVSKGEFMEFEYSFPAKNIMHWTMNTCFAYEGMKRIGAEKKYECGLLYRVRCWLDTLGVEYTLHPNISGCLKAECNKCSGDILFKLQ